MVVCVGVQYLLLHKDIAGGADGRAVVELCRKNEFSDMVSLNSSVR